MKSLWEIQETFYVSRPQTKNNKHISEIKAPNKEFTSDGEYAAG